MKKKYLFILPIVLILIMVSAVLNNLVKAAGSSQTIQIDVLSDDVAATPGIYYYQLDNGTFNADLGNNNSINVNNGGTNMNPAPKTTKLWVLFNFGNWTASTYKDINKNSYNKSQLKTGPALSKITYVSADSYKGVEGPYIKNATEANIVVETGKAYNVTKINPIGATGKRHNTSYPKWEMIYHAPVNVRWKGTIEETKRIRVVEDSVLAIGQSKQLKAEVDTRIAGGNWQGYWDVSDRASETTWRSSDSSIVSVDSKGKVTAKKNGKVTITARWQKGKYDIQATAQVSVTNDDVLFIGGEKNTCVGETIQLKASLTKKGGGNETLTSHSKLTWTSSNSSVATVSSSGLVTPKANGKVTITAHYKDTGIDVKNTHEITVSADCGSGGGGGGGEPEPDPGLPPQVVISGPSQVKAGEEFCITAIASDPDGTVENYYWGAAGMSNPPGNESSKCGVYYMQEGTKLVSVIVDDNDGNYSTPATHTIEVLPPYPVAAIHVGGTEKENRKVTMTIASYSPKYFPINWSNSTLTIQPLENQSVNSIKTTKGDHTIKDGKVHFTNLSANENIDLLFKEKGKYLITHYVINSANLSDEIKPERTIIEDLNPVAQFSAVTHVYRHEEFQNHARLYMTNQATSEDDFIERVIYEVVYDTNNDGTFDDAVMTFNSKLLTVDKQTEFTHPNGMKVFATMDEDFNLELLVPRVGQYKIYQTAIEGFGQPTIEQFINDADYRRNKTN